MIVHLVIVAAVAMTAACSARDQNFGSPADTGNDASDSADAARDAAREPAGVGEACTGPTDCIEGALCIGTTDASFECMSVCESPYDRCDDGSLCLPVTSGASAICYTGGAAQRTEPCTTNLDCGPGLLCLGANGEFYCQDACPDRDLPDGGCGPGRWCLPLTSSSAGVCRASVGSACATAADCPDQLSCSPELFSAPALPDGYCTQSCASDGDCPSGVCRTIVGTSSKSCLRTCEHRSDCRFNGSYDCLDASVCAASSDPSACQLMFGEQSLCLPGAL